MSATSRQTHITICDLAKQSPVTGLSTSIDLTFTSGLANIGCEVEGTIPKLAITRHRNEQWKSTMDLSSNVGKGNIDFRVTSLKSVYTCVQNGTRTMYRAQEASHESFH